MSPEGAKTIEGERGKRVALVSDVHGNLPAFEAVIADIERTRVDEIWCLGDLVGYGASPNECVEMARKTCDLCLIGNHDLVVLGKLDIDDFSTNAALAATWTREHISQEAVDYLSKLEAVDTEREIGLYHASPRDPVWEYVLSTSLADACLDTMSERVGAVGHSHVALYFARKDGEPTVGEHAPGGTELDISTGEWIINPGGVGQPRDGDPRAAWMLLDFGAWRASWHRTKYPIEDAAKAIEEAELPQALSDRLYYGQ